MHSLPRAVRFCNFEHRLIRYTSALKLQGDLAAEVQAGGQDAALLLQHRPVYTIGKRGALSDFKQTPEQLQALGIDVVHAPRGGEVTFHGPGQLVLYPVVQLRRLGLGPRAYVEALEDVVIHLAADYGIRAEGRQEGRTGVWTADRKLAAIGVRISQGVATHGLALNISTDLSAFEHIVPCGITDKGVTSISAELNASSDLQQAAQRLTVAFLKKFGYTDHRLVSFKLPIVS